MRQLSCKRLSIFLVLFLTILSLHAQDTSKAVARPIQKSATQSAKQPSTAKPQAPARKLVMPQTAAPSAKVPSGPVDNSLNGQYEDLLKHSWMQQGYKVINPGRLTTLWKSVNDTLSNTRRQLTEAQKQLARREEQITALQKESPSAKTDTAQHSQQQRVQVNEVEVLGMSVETGTYNWIAGGTILALALALAIVLFTVTKNSNDARQHKQLYEEISSEYQTYKAKSKEKELKLARELQTERNTIEELRAQKSNEETSGRGKK